MAGSRREFPILRGHCVEDLTAIPVAPWKRTGVRGSFINLVGSGRTRGAYARDSATGETQHARISLLDLRSFRRLLRVNILKRSGRKIFAVGMKIKAIGRDAVQRVVLFS